MGLIVGARLAILPSSCAITSNSFASRKSEGRSASWSVRNAPMIAPSSAPSWITARLTAGNLGGAGGE